MPVAPVCPVYSLELGDRVLVPFYALLAAQQSLTNVNGLPLWFLGPTPWCCLNGLHLPPLSELGRYFLAPAAFVAILLPVFPSLFLLWALGQMVLLPL